MRVQTHLAALLAAALAVGACDGNAVTSGMAGGAEAASPPDAPSLSWGPTTSVTVTCPPNLAANQSGRCVAYGVDSQGHFTGSNASGWTSSNTSAATVTSAGIVTGQPSGGTTTISATIGGVTGNTSLSVRPGTPTVTITGPWEVRSNSNCTWTAVTSGGTPTGFSWSVQGASGSPNWDTWTGTPTTNTIALEVTATFSGGATDYSGFLVVVSDDPWVPAC